MSTSRFVALFVYARKEWTEIRSSHKWRCVMCRDSFEVLRKSDEVKVCRACFILPGERASIATTAVCCRLVSKLYGRWWHVRYFWPKYPDFLRGCCNLVNNFCSVWMTPNTELMQRPAGCPALTLVISDKVIFPHKAECSRGHLITQSQTTFNSWSDICPEFP